MTQIFVDMDGVLADFDTGYELAFGERPDKTTDNVDWKLIKEKGDFFFSLPPMPDFMELWQGILKYHSDPIILTGVPKSIVDAPEQKMAWKDKYLGSDVKIITCLSWKKADYIQNKGDIIIDDWVKHRPRWIRRGGRWILHTSARTSIEELDKLWNEF